MKWLLTLGLLLPGVAQDAPSQADIDDYRALVVQDLRLATIGYRLAKTNAPFCPHKDYNPGWVIHDIAQYPDKDIARAAFGFDQSVEIAAIVPGGPADKEGVRVGDGFVELRGRDLPTVEEGSKSTYSRVGMVKELANQSWRTRNLSIIGMVGEKGPYNLIFYPEEICLSDFQVDTKNKVDAGADGNMVSVTFGLMQFAANDDELAAAVAHEMAHNLLRHPDQLAALKKERKRNSKAVRATEEEADRLSVWLLHNAGYDLDKALAFWERFGRKYDPFLSDGTHPGWKKRVAMMKVERAAIMALGKAGPVHPPLLATTR